MYFRRRNAEVPEDAVRIYLMRIMDIGACPGLAARGADLNFATGSDTAPQARAATGIPLDRRNGNQRALKKGSVQEVNKPTGSQFGRPAPYL